MARYLLLGSMVCVLGLAACQQTKVTAAPPISPEQFPTVRDSWVKAAPDLHLLVGLVTAVDPKAMTATLDQIDVSQVKAGDLMTVVDSHEAMLADATVTEVDTNTLQIHFTPQAGQRMPQVGDLAMRTGQ